MRYRVCYDIPGIPGICRKETIGCYITDSEYDAKVYINEMHALGDYSGYYIIKEEVKYFENEDLANQFIKDNKITNYHFETPTYLENGMDLVYEVTNEDAN